MCAVALCAPADASSAGRAKGCKRGQPSQRAVIPPRLRVHMLCPVCGVSSETCGLLRVDSFRGKTRRVSGAAAFIGLPRTESLVRGLTSRPSLDFIYSDFSLSRDSRFLPILLLLFIFTPFLQSMLIFLISIFFFLLGMPLIGQIMHFRD